MYWVHLNGLTFVPDLFSSYEYSVLFDAIWSFDIVHNTSIEHLEQSWSQEPSVNFQCVPYPLYQWGPWWRGSRDSTGRTRVPSPPPSAPSSRTPFWLEFRGNTSSIIANRSVSDPFTPNSIFVSISLCLLLMAKALADLVTMSNPKKCLRGQMSCAKELSNWASQMSSSVYVFQSGLVSMTRALLPRWDRQLFFTPKVFFCFRRNERNLRTLDVKCSVSIPAAPWCIYRYARKRED